MRRRLPPFLTLVLLGAVAGAVPVQAGEIVRLLVDPRATGKRVSPLLFATQIEFFQKALARGTLPAEHPESQRVRLASALREAGVRALRFPGGTPGEWYIWRPEYQEMMRPLLARVPNGDTRYVTPLDAVLTFAREQGLAIIYQLNCAFVATDGGLAAIQRASDGPRAHPRPMLDLYRSYYDGDRITAAAEEVRALVRHVRARGYPVVVWEVGNEEFAYLTAEQYAAVAEAYIRAIRREDAETPIAVVAYGAPALTARGVGDAIAYVTAHYPFADWGPGGRRMERLASLDTRMAEGLLQVAASRPSGTPHTRLAITETTVFFYPRYDPYAFVPTFAHALVLAYNWFQLIKDRLTDVAVFHEFVTPYFGLVRYDAAWYGPGVMWGGMDIPPPRATGAPLVTFPDRFLVTPSSVVFRLLSDAAGASVLPFGVEGVPPGRPGLEREYLVVGRDGEVMLFAVNRSAQAREVTVGLAGGATWTAAAPSGVQVVAEALDATLPGTFHLRPLPVRRTAEAALAFPLPPYAVVHVRMAWRALR